MKQPLYVIVAIAIAFAPALHAQTTRPAVAATLPTGWEEIDQRLVFFTVQLASVEASIDAVNKALRQGGYAQAVKQGRAEQFQKNNEMMDRQGGGPVGWKDFYGKTAEQFFFHPKEQAAVSIRVSQERHAEGVYQKMAYTQADRPPQFDYIYKANENAQQRAEAEVAKLGGKVDALTERRRQLEKEQASIWAKIAFEAVTSRKLVTKPAYRFELKVNGTDDVSAQRQEAVRASAAFVRKVLRAISDAQTVIDNDPEATFVAFQKVVGDASSELTDRLVRSPKLALEVGDTSTLLGKIAASADRMTDVTRNIAESYRGSMDRDQADDSQKQTFRAFTQSSLFDCAANIATTADYVLQLSKEWNAEVDVANPVPATPPTVVANVQVNPEAKVNPSTNAVDSEAAAHTIDLLSTMRGNTGRRDNGAIVLKPDPNYEKITSDQAFVAPVRFKIVAMIDSGDLRFKYAADQIIFHWADRPSELRIDGGPANGRHSPGAGDVPLNEWVEYEITVLPDSLTLKVNGELRYHTMADFSAVNEPLTISPAIHNTAKIKSVTAEILPDKQSAASTEGAPSNKSLTLEIKGMIDGTDVVKFGRTEANWTHKEWSWPTKMQVNGVDWDPHAKPTLVYRGALGMLRDYDFSTARVIEKKGRGSLSLELHDDGCEISFSDGALGAGEYSMKIRVQHR
jgi:hypothetical protein